MTYVLATLSSPYIQLMAEKHGWHLFGIVPGFDRELFPSGEIKRVYEAVYCKVLVPDEDLVRPHAKNLTANTKALFDLLFPGKVVE